MTRTLDVKFRALRNGADYAEIYPASSSRPVLRMNDDGAIKMSMNAEFAADSKIDWLTDEIQPVLVIDGVEYNLGVFIPTTASETEDEDVASVSVEAYDRAWRVQDTKAETAVFFAAGTTYLSVIESLLTASGIGLVRATATSAVLTEARQDWEIGTSYLTIINELLQEINYRSLWFDLDGVAVLEPASAPTGELIQHTLDSSNIKSLLLPTYRRTTDIFNAPNVFVCVCNNPDKSAQMIATAVNDNPLSPLSTINRGRRIVQSIKLNNIADQATLQAYADSLRNEAMGIHETVAVETALFPGYGVDDVTVLRYKDYAGVFTERKWEMELVTGGTMRHTLERVIYSV